MSGRGDEPERLRKELKEDISKRCDELRPEAEWREICEMSHEEALKILGEQEKPHERPWFRGKERER